MFENLAEVDDRGMQEILRQVPSDKLLLALKGAITELGAIGRKPPCRRFANAARTAGDGGNAVTTSGEQVNRHTGDAASGTSDSDRTG